MKLTPKIKKSILKGEVFYLLNENCDRLYYVLGIYQSKNNEKGILAQEYFDTYAFGRYQLQELKLLSYEETVEYKKIKKEKENQ